jgi:hypothetical protein
MEGGQSGGCTDLALHQPQAPSCIKKACSTSTSPHNPPSVCTKLHTHLPSYAYPVEIHSESRAHTLTRRPFTIADDSRGTNQPLPTSAHLDPTSASTSQITTGACSAREQITAPLPSADNPTPLYKASTRELQLPPDTPHPPQLALLQSLRPITSKKHLSAF